MKQKSPFWSSVTRRGVLAGAAITLAAVGTLPHAARADKEPVVLGLVTELSGSQAEFGQRNLRVAELFQEEWNAKGGIDGRQVEIVSGDAQEQPDVAISLGKRFVAENHVTGFFGTGGSGLTLAFSKALKNTKVPIMLSYIWGNDNTGPDLPSVYRIGPYNAYVAMLMAKYLVDAGYKNPVILAEDSAYGTDFAASLQQALGDALALEIVPYQAKIQDLSPVLGELAQRPTQPDAIIMAGNYQIIYSVQNQIPAAGLKSQIIGAWDYPATPQYWETAGKNGVGIIYATFSNDTVALTPTGEAFKAAYVAKFDRDPLFYEYFLWDCLNALRVAVEQSGSVDPATLTEALAKVDFEGTVTQIHFQRREGTTVWNQALAGSLYMKQFTAENQTDAEATVKYEAAP